MEVGGILSLNIVTSLWVSPSHPSFCKRQALFHILFVVQSYVDLSPLLEIALPSGK